MPTMTYLLEILASVPHYVNKLEHHDGEPLCRVTAYGHKRYVLAYFKRRVHAHCYNKHIRVYIIVSTDCELFLHILSVRTYTSAI